jgi:hypothetical protein
MIKKIFFFLYFFPNLEQKVMIGTEKIGKSEEQVEDPNTIQKFEKMLNQGIIKKRKFNFNFNSHFIFHLLHIYRAF